MNVQTKREGFVDASTDNDRPVEEAIDTKPPPEPTETWPVKVKLLHKPIRNGRNEEIKELSFREPTGADINRIGNPVRIDQRGEIIIDDNRMLLMMGNLSGVLTPLLERMDPRDYNSCAYRLRNFFIPDLAAWLD
jgi:hypothetical protein